MSEMKYELRLTASGTVHDADGNVVSQEPIEATVVVTEAELQALFPSTPSEGDPS